MGRVERSQGLAPPSIRKDVRARQARHIVNKIIPAILASDARARQGVENSELVVDPPPLPLNGVIDPDGDTRAKADTVYITRKGQGRRKLKSNGIPMDDGIIGEKRESTRKGRGKNKQRGDSFDIARPKPNPSFPSSRGCFNVRIIASDTLTVARMLAYSSQNGRIAPIATKPHGKAQNVCILNMASPLRPGGGVLAGATSQEEFLCARTTLLPSLKENFYRLPELGGIWTSDVLVFRSAAPLGESQGELVPKQRYWVNVISAAMLRFPELEGDEGEEKRLSKKDRGLVQAKMRAVLRIAASKGVKKLVLGAWGCGAYANPVADIAKEWKNVISNHCLMPEKGRKNTMMDAEIFDGIEDITFAINNNQMAHTFAHAFGGDIEVELGLEKAAEDNDGDEQDDVVQELQLKISEVQGQLDKVWNPELRARMKDILDELRSQLRQRESPRGASHEGAENEQDQDIEANSGTMLDRTTEGLTVKPEEKDQSDEFQYSGNEGGIRIDQ